VLGHRFDITLEALAYGGVAGLRVLALTLVFALFSAAVDPDETLALVRRFSYRSALTASLATRLVPVLARDAARMGDAARCRPVQPRRGTVARAAVAGALDRAVDVAAALELRGFALPRGRARPARAPWSRHDLRVGACAGLMASVAVLGRLAEVGQLEAYPRLAAELGPAELGLALGVAGLALAPLAGMAARLGVARA